MTTWRRLGALLCVLSLTAQWAAARPGSDHLRAVAKDGDVVADKVIADLTNWSKHLPGSARQEYQNNKGVLSVNKAN